MKEDVAKKLRIGNVNAILDFAKLFKKSVHQIILISFQS